MLKLYPYQAEDVKFLVSAGRALNANDMGLGKTAEALSACKQLGAKRILVVCPKIIKNFWAEQVKIWYPEMTAIATDFVPPCALPSVFLITHYEMVRPQQYLKKGKMVTLPYKTLLEDILKVQWDAVIVDEAHRLKNRKAQQTKGIKLLAQKPKTVYLLTGTPILNRIDELWSLLNTLYPKKYSSFWKFVQKFARAFRGKFGWIILPEPMNLPALQNELKGIFLRREKSETQLPEMTTMTYRLDLAPEQALLYAQMKKEAKAVISETKILTAPIVLAQMTRLKQIAISSQMVGGKEAGSKLEACLDIINDTDQRAVIFSQFSQAIKLLSGLFAKSGISHCLMTGGSTDNQRTLQLKKFREDNSARAFLATVGVGGIGLDLSCASIVIFLDELWTPALNQQAISRVHRHGQKQNVTVIRLLAKNTIEDYIEETLNKKTSIIEQILNISQEYFVGN